VEPVIYMVSAERKPIADVWWWSTQWGPGPRGKAPGQGTKPPESGGILISDATNKIETGKDKFKLECGPMPNVIVTLTNIGGALCSTPQNLADAHYLTAVQ